MEKSTVSTNRKAYHEFQIIETFEAAIKNIHQIRNQSLKKIAQEYDWKRLAGVYDSKFEKITW